MELTIRTQTIRGPLRHFWKSTGFTPASLLLDPAMRQTLSIIGSAPNRAVRFVRIHFLLDLVGMEVSETGPPRFDWDRLDDGLDQLVNNGLAPVFELMGNPGGYFSDFNNDRELHLWRDMVSELVRHLIRRYGADEVAGWYFETWNEPDIGWWHQWPQVEPFCRYYDACSEGLTAVNPDLPLGGPGTCRPLSPLFKGFLEHCDRGINYFTGERGAKLDFVSIHEKGVRSHVEDLTPDSKGICRRELDAVEYIRNHHPRLADLPFMNNECDPQVGWSQIHTWRGTAYYAGFIAKAVVQHHRDLVKDHQVVYELLSNDNGFLGTWGNRTHLTRFGTDEQLSRGAHELVIKPSLAVMGLLSQLGEEELEVEGLPEPWDPHGALATSGDWGYAALVYASDDSPTRSGERETRLVFQGLADEELALVHYRIDAETGNPFGVWEAAGAPAVPTEQQLQSMWWEQQHHLVATPQTVRPEAGRVEYTLSARIPSVHLVKLLRKPSGDPEKVTGLRAQRYRSLTSADNLLLVWDQQPNHSLMTYRVFFAEGNEESPVQVNTADTLYASYLHARHTKTGRGRYHVQAVDYWGRGGPRSDELEA